VSWSKAARDEGEDVLLELIESGGIKSRLRPGLPPNSKITYPHNQQVFITTEKIKKQEGAVEETELNEIETAEDPAGHEAFLKGFTSHKVQIKYMNEQGHGPDTRGQ